VFVRTMTQKLLTYAVGRGLEPSDMPAVRAIVRSADTQNDRFSALVLGVVESDPFQMRMKLQPEAIAPAVQAASVR